VDTEQSEKMFALVWFVRCKEANLAGRTAG